MCGRYGGSSGHPLPYTTSLPISTRRATRHTPTHATHKIKTLWHTRGMGMGWHIGVFSLSFFKHIQHCRRINSAGGKVGKALLATTHIQHGNHLCLDTRIQVSSNPTTRIKLKMMYLKRCIMAGTKISEIKESSIKRVIKRISVCNYSHFFPLENSLDPTLSTVENQYKQTQKKKQLRGV